MRFPMLLGFMMALFIIPGCGVTTTHVDPATKTVDITTYTLLKSVNGFELEWTKDDRVVVKLRKSTPEMEFIAAITPLMREMAPMMKALAEAKVQIEMAR